VGPPAAAASPYAPPAQPGEPPAVVDLRDLEDPHDPLAGSWGAGYGQPGVGREDLTLTPERYAGYPSGPDGRPASGDQTEQLPRVGEVGPADDALGVYGMPSHVAPGVPGLTGDADPVGHLRGLPGGRRLPAGVSALLDKVPGRDRIDRLPPDRKILVIGGAAIALVLVVVLMKVVFGGGGEDPVPPPTAAATTGQNAPAGTPKDFAKLSTASAQKDLKKAGEGGGEIVGAWRWTDKNGRNLLVTTREKSGGNQTLRVIHVARLDKTPKTLRVMVDPNLPNCKGGGGAAGFTKNSVQVRDLDKDNVAEVLVGWSARCGGTDAASIVKLAVLSNGDKYILRGEGVVGGHGGKAPAPDPASKSWPKPYLKAANTEFKDLFF
jgi:hypothetical protein